MEASDTGGVKPISIEGRMASQRERMLGMTNDERMWRARYLKSLVLAEDEPVVPKNQYKELYNPIRRFYRVPLNILESAITPVMGAHNAYITRLVTAKVLMGIGIVYYGWYYFKYNKKDWTHRSGWSVFVSRPAVLPGSPEFDNYKHREPQGKDYNTLGFNNSPL